MREQEIQSKIRAALSSPERLVFRTNSGCFWQGEIRYSAEFKQPVLIKLRKVDGLPEGFSDLLVIDKGGAAFIETKAPGGRVGEKQRNFLRIMRSLGHRAGVARSSEDAFKIIVGMANNDEL